MHSGKRTAALNLVLALDLVLNLVRKYASRDLPLAAAKRACAAARADAAACGVAIASPRAGTRAGACVRAQPAGSGDWPLPTRATLLPA